MFAGIRRVISNPDRMDEDPMMPSPSAEEQAECIHMAHHHGDAVLVEPSNTTQTSDTAPLTLIHSRSNSSAMSSSTLSEDDRPDPNTLDVDETVSPSRHVIRRHLDSEELSQRAMSSHSSRDWGWFEDVHQQVSQKVPAKRKQRQEEDDDLDPIMHLRETNLEDSAAAMAVTAPTYVLEESLSSQQLWKTTAGQRPPQPIEVRAFYEKMWSLNFHRSQVDYDMPSEVLTAASPILMSPWTDGNFTQDNGDIESYNLSNPSSKRPNNPTQDGNVAEAALVSRMNNDSNGCQQVINRKVQGTEGDLTVLVKGDNVFGTTVSKSFIRSMGQGVDTVNVSIASYRVVESPDLGKYAQFLVIYREGSIQDTIGVWKRYRDFEELARKVTHPHEGCSVIVSNMSPLSVTEEGDIEHLPNAIMSWRLLQKRKRWYRCLDAGYLSLKVFLLERFLHDILFESTSPQLLREFVGPLHFN